MPPSRGSGADGWWNRVPLAGDRLVVVGPDDRVDGLVDVEVSGALDARHEADQDAVPHDLSFQAGGDVGVPDRLTAVAQDYTHPDLVDALAGQVSIGAPPPQHVHDCASGRTCGTRRARVRPRQWPRLRAPPRARGSDAQHGRHHADDPTPDPAQPLPRHRPAAARRTRPGRVTPAVRAARAERGARAGRVRRSRAPGTRGRQIRRRPRRDRRRTPRPGRRLAGRGVRRWLCRPCGRRPGPGRCRSARQRPGRSRGG